MSDSSAVAVAPAERPALMEVPKRTAGDIMELVIAKGDLASLAPAERARYYVAVCESIGLNPLTKPFDYIELDGKLTLYPTRGATDQLRKIYQVSIELGERKEIDGVYLVTARATLPDGRIDEATGAVPSVKEGGTWETANSGKRYFKGNGQFTPLSPADRANALMKVETKAKRRATLSAIGLPFLDETELDTVRGARPVIVDHDTGEIIGGDAAVDDENSDEEITTKVTSERERAMKALHVAARSKKNGEVEVDKFPGEPDVHLALRDLACPAFGVESMKELTTEQLKTFRHWISSQTPDLATAKLDIVRTMGAAELGRDLDAISDDIRDRKLGDDLVRTAFRFHRNRVSAATATKQPIAPATNDAPVDPADAYNAAVSDEIEAEFTVGPSDDEIERIEWHERIDSVIGDTDRDRQQKGWTQLIDLAGTDEWRWVALHLKAPNAPMLNWILERTIERKMRTSAVYDAERQRARQLGGK